MPNIIGDSRGKNRFLTDVCVCVCVYMCMVCSFTYFEDCEHPFLHQYNFIALGMVICKQGCFSVTILMIREEKNKKGMETREKKKRLQYFLYLNLQSFPQSWSFIPPTHWFFIYIKSGFITQVRAVTKRASLLLPCVSS